MTLQIILKIFLVTFWCCAMAQAFFEYFLEDELPWWAAKLLAEKDWGLL